MCRRLIYIISFVSLLGFAANSSFGELVGYYSMNEGSGTVIGDASGYEHHGSAPVAPTWVDGPPGYGKALSFDGSVPMPSVVNCGTWNPSEGTGQFTVALWLLWNGPNTRWQGVVCKRDSNNGEPEPMMWYLEMSEQNNNIFFGRRGSWPAGGPQPHPIGQWDHIAVTFDGTNATLYMNAEQRGQGAFTLGPGTNTAILIGGDELDLTNSFNGSIDEVRLYNTALTQPEIQAAMRELEFVRVRTFNPSPSNGQIEVTRDASLIWKPGKYAAKHNVYLGKDFNDVSEAGINDPRNVLVSPNQDPNRYDPTSPLEWGQTYYWRVDEVSAPSKPGFYKGDVWSFTVANFTIVDNFETYDDVNNLVRSTWLDCVTNNTGMTVGNEKSIFRSGKQSMYMRYDNDGSINQGLGAPLEKTGTLTYSEAERRWADAQDWTKDGAASLNLWFRGLIEPGTYTEGPPIKMTAAGTDIGGTADGFFFVYRQMTGNGSIVAKVNSLASLDPNAPPGGTAKAGVMIRELLDAGSKMVSVSVTPANGVMYRRRTTANVSPIDVLAANLTAPYWVKLTRTGNSFKAERSPDNVSWTAMGVPSNITMASKVNVGLCLTSNNIYTTYETEISNVTAGGTGAWQAKDINTQNNMPAQLYIVLEDSANNLAIVKHPDPATTTIPNWAEWPILLTDFTNVNPSLNLQAIKKMIIGVGEIGSTTPGGSGTLYIDDIRLYRP
jgi:hypothetical protein